MMKISTFVLFFFSLKLLLDYMSPFREVNFMIFNLICVFFIVSKVTKIKCISPFEWLTMVFFTGLCLLWLLVGGDIRYFVKFISLVLVYLAVRLSTELLSVCDLVKICEKILSISFVLFFINVLLSIALKDPLNRQFYNFEHANLLGSYVLLSLVYVYSFCLLKEEKLIQKFSIVVSSLISTSTGAFLASLFVFVDLKKVNLRAVFIVVATSLVIISCLYNVTKLFFPDLYVKTFGPVNLIFSGNWYELVELSKYKLPLQSLGDDYQSSLVWRFYAYIVFWDFFWEQPLLNILIGAGFWGFSQAWDGIAPHNDFLLILIDFGVLGFVLSLYLLLKSFLRAFKVAPLLIPIYIIIFLRLMFENNIYSYYLMSSFVMNAAFLYSVRKRLGV